MSQDYQHNLFFLLHDVARLIRVEADKRAKLHGMTRAQWSIIMRLSRNPGLSQKEVADLLEVEPISVARLIDRLAMSGLVERRADEQDRRIWRLHLLPAGEAMLAEIERQWGILAEHVAYGVPQEMRDIMVEGLLQMKANILSAPQASPLHAALAAAQGQDAVAHIQQQAKPESILKESA
jgi:DNA-binding MarR family transcriptional regulator